jgi:hypothetical protein
MRLASYSHRKLPPAYLLGSTSTVAEARRQQKVHRMQVFSFFAGLKSCAEEWSEAKQTIAGPCEAHIQFLTR